MKQGRCEPPKVGGSNLSKFLWRTTSAPARLWKASTKELSRCFQVHPADNVATMLDDAGREEAVEVLGDASARRIELAEHIKLGHKVALDAIAEGEPVMKFGVPIGQATRHIMPGEWVHLHNCRSYLDERSSTLDLESGATTDTKYE